MKILLNLLITSAISFILALIFPYKPSSNLVYNRFNPSISRYNKLESLSIPLLFIIVPVIAAIITALGILMRVLLYTDSYSYIVTTPTPYLLMCGLILGFGLIRIPLEFLYKRLLRNEYSLYIDYVNSKHGFDGIKAWRFFEIVLTFCGIILFVWGMNWYVRIDKNEKIEMNDFFSDHTYVYPISEISQLECLKFYDIRMNEKREIKHYVIKMNDNFVFNTNIYNFFCTENEKRILDEKMRDLSKITKIPIQEYITK